jgi:hypothetical protein
VTLLRLPTPYAVDFTHRGEYPEDPNDRRPHLTVRLMSFDQSGQMLKEYETGVMVDSGAKLTVLKHATAVALGLTDLANLRKYEPGTLTGAVAGDSIQCAIVPLMVLICERWLDLRAMFPLEDEPDPVHQLLGADGVFDEAFFGFGGGEAAVYASA